MALEREGALQCAQVLVAVDEFTRAGKSALQQADIRHVLGASAPRQRPGNVRPMV
jgi:hypothetical protein